MLVSVCLSEPPQQENLGINPAAVHSGHSLWAREAFARYTTPVLW